MIRERKGSDNGGLEIPETPPSLKENEKGGSFPFIAPGS
jgi:hypothetical protein